MLWLDSASEMDTGAAVAAAAVVAAAAAEEVAAAALRGRIMSIEKKGLTPEALAVTLPWAATLGAILAPYDCGVTTLPRSTPPWLLAV